MALVVHKLNVYYIFEINRGMKHLGNFILKQDKSIPKINVILESDEYFNVDQIVNLNVPSHPKVDYIYIFI